MRTAAVMLVLVATIASVAPVASAQTADSAGYRPEEKHPRLILTPTLLADVREAVNQTGSHHERVLEAMRRRVDDGLTDLEHGPHNRQRAVLARQAAAIYAVTEDPRYADLAFEALKLIDENPKERGLPDAGDGLDRAAAGMAFALVYDWCYPAWDTAKRDAIRGRILDALDAWPKYGHSTFGGDKVSYWNAVCRSAELMLMLAAYQERPRARRFEDVKKLLTQHIDHAYGPTGLSQEGPAAVAEAGVYLAPAVAALHGVGDKSLDTALASRPWWKLAMFSTSMVSAGEHGRRMLQTGVSPSAPGDRGWLSVLIPTVPADRLPHYLWFYDRTLGRQAVGGDDDAACFDALDAGSTWALLCYPTDGVSADPRDTMGHVLADTARGAYLFRNRWYDGDDVLIGLTADVKHAGFAWDRPEALNLSVVAFGKPFIGGPAKQRRAEFVSAMLVDGKADRGRNADEDTGRIDTFETTNDGGYAIVAGGTQYEKLGLSDIRRHLLVNFSRDSGYDLFATLDRVTSADGKTHDFAYQLNIGDEKGDAGLAVTTSEESGRPTFTLTADDGAFCKGWVVAPAGMSIKAGDPLRIETRAVIADIWVVMIVGRGTPPTATVTGDGLRSAFRLGGATLRYDPQTNRLVHD